MRVGRCKDGKIKKRRKVGTERRDEERNYDIKSRPKGPNENGHCSE